jgi:glycosyltransferase involved in cell wall biosynthesis
MITVSVVVASYNSRSTIRRCLDALTRQDTEDAYEIIVVDSSTDDTAEIISREFDGVSLRRSMSRLFPGDARNVGVRHARGAILAFTDADCVVTPGWVAQIADVHRRSQHPIIGGAVENGNPDSYVGWASYFLEFTSWMPHRPSGEVVEIPTTCLTMKRWLFDTYGPFIEGTYCSDTAFNWKVGRNGYSPFFCPAISVAHINTTDLGRFLARKAFHGKSFARVRTTEQRFSVFRRAVYVLLMPVLPLVLFARIARRAPHSGARAVRFALASPVVFCGLVAWSWGEMLGYLSPADARQR